MEKAELDAFMINWMQTHENNVLPGAMLMKHGPEDYVGAALAVRGTLYFHGSHTANVREAICRCFNHYEAIAKTHLTWFAFAQLLNAEHGHAGFAFNLSLVRKHENESTEAVMGSKMAGLDAGSAVLIAARHKIGIVDHIKTVSWLTAINTKMIEASGGMQRICSELPRDWFAKYDYGSGIVIQAGPEPDLVPVELDAKPAIYVLPNMTFQKIRVPEIESLHQGSFNGEPRLYDAAAEDWLTRFDIPDSELLACQARLLAEPRLTPETTLPGAL